MEFQPYLTSNQWIHEKPNPERIVQLFLRRKNRTTAYLYELSRDFEKRLTLVRELKAARSNYAYLTVVLRLPHGVRQRPGLNSDSVIESPVWR